MLALGLALATSASGQVWNSDREIARPGVFDLITGQFPRHGRTYWEDQAFRCEARLIRRTFDLQVRNDLASAYIELGETGRARAVLEIVESLSPGRPDVLYNLGACAKKEGDFAAALALATRAGADDLELKSLAWRAALAAGFSDRDFLGRAYQEWPGSSSVVEYESLLALIVRDREFVDAYLVLGDELFRRGARNAAIWAWVRALVTGHPAAFQLRRRLDFAFYVAGAGGGRDPDPVEAAIRGISACLESAEEWHRRCEAIERRLVFEGWQPDLEGLERECARRRLRKVGPEDFPSVAVSPAELALAESRTPVAATPAARQDASSVPWLSFLSAALLFVLGYGLSVLLRGIPRWSPPRERPLNVTRAHA